MSLTTVCAIRSDTVGTPSFLVPPLTVLVGRHVAPRVGQQTATSGWSTWLSGSLTITSLSKQFQQNRESPCIPLDQKNHRLARAAVTILR